MGQSGVCSIASEAQLLTDAVPRRLCYRLDCRPHCVSIVLIRVLFWLLEGSHAQICKRDSYSTVRFQCVSVSCLFKEAFRAWQAAPPPYARRMPTVGWNVTGGFCILSQTWTVSSPGMKQLSVRAQESCLDKQDPAPAPPCLSIPFAAGFPIVSHKHD